jgi:hypothetical protein
LGQIAFYCTAHELPTLNSNVVGKKRGTPGKNLPLDPEDFDKERERVYATNWYDVYPPSEAELEMSYSERQIST